MFNDRYGLTQAVLEGRKTMTRRIIKAPKTMEGEWVSGFAVVKEPNSNEVIEVFALDADEGMINTILPKYKVGEVVAVAQAYKDCFGCPDFLFGDRPGWVNKMFVCAEFMPHQIRITNVRVERLQDISEEDCLREGIYNWKDAPDCPPGHKDSKIECFGYDGSWDGHLTPITAFAALIDKVSGKGTWENNPWVFVYEFELVK